jgi:hypothetical protein
MKNLDLLKLASQGLTLESLAPYAVDKMKEEGIKTYVLRLIQDENGKDTVELKQYTKDMLEAIAEMAGANKKLEYEKNTIYNDAVEKIQDLENKILELQKLNDELTERNLVLQSQIDL